MTTADMWACSPVSADGGREGCVIRKLFISKNSSLLLCPWWHNFSQIWIVDIQENFQILGLSFYQGFPNNAFL